MFSKKPHKLTKSSPSIWHYKVSVKFTVKISSIFVAFLENTNLATKMKNVIKFDLSINVDRKLGVSWNVYTVENISQVDQE